MTASIYGIGPEKLYPVPQGWVVGEAGHDSVVLGTRSRSPVDEWGLNNF